MNCTRCGKENPAEIHTCTPPALTLADSISRMDTFTEYQRAELDKAAAELRRQYEEIEALRADAERYRWLKTRKGLTLRSEKYPNLWKRIDGTDFHSTHSLAEGGTQHGPAESLDAVIDAARSKT